MQVMRLFPTPVVVDDLPDCEPLNIALEAIVREQREKDPGVALSNRGGWQSKHDFPVWSGDEGKTLLAHAQSLATANVGAGAQSSAQWRIESWANISSTGHFNMPHIHGGSFWSCVYYVKAGEEGGKLVLHDPRMPALRMHAPGVRFKNCGPEIKAEIQPRPGLMVLFPAWLSHSVEPWDGAEERISIAMNIRSARWSPGAGG